MKFYSILEGETTDVLRRFLRLIRKSNDKIEALESAVGGNSSGLVKDVNSLKTAVGGNSSGLVKDVNSLKTAVGDEETANTILYRIKVLEDAQTPTEPGEGG